MKTVTYADSVPHKNTPRKDRIGFQLDHVKVGKVNSVSKRKVIEKETEVRHVIWPWRKSYKAWWGVSTSSLAACEMYKRALKTHKIFPL